MAMSYLIAAVVVWGGLLWLADATKDYKGTYSREWFDERRRVQGAIDRAEEQEPSGEHPLNGVLSVVVVIAVLVFVLSAFDAPIG